MTKNYCFLSSKVHLVSSEHIRVSLIYYAILGYTYAILYYAIHMLYYTRLYICYTTLGYTYAILWNLINLAITRPPKSGHINSVGLMYDYGGLCCSSG